MLGAAILLVATARGSNAAAVDLTGAAMSLSAAAFFAAYLLTTEHVREEMDTLTFNAAAIVGSVATVLIVCRAGIAARRVHDAHVAGAARPRSDLAARRVPRADVCARPRAGDGGSVSLLAQVPLTAILAVPLLGEPLTLPYLVGGGLVLTGIYIVTARSR